MYILIMSCSKDVGGTVKSHELTFFSWNWYDIELENSNNDCTKL